MASALSDRGVQGSFEGLLIGAACSITLVLLGLASLAPSTMLTGTGGPASLPSAFPPPAPSPRGNLTADEGCALLHQRSSRRCVLGKTFGCLASSVWVNGGCRGVFGVMQPSFNGLLKKVACGDYRSSSQACLLDPPPPAPRPKPYPLDTR